MSKGATPKANAMLLCDSVITEVGTNKKTLIGVFENINVIKFPTIHHFLAVYIKLTAAKGTYRFKLELVNLQSNTIIGKGEIPQDIAINNPLGAHELVFNLGDLRFDTPGGYEFRIFANDKIFEQKTFLVRRIEIKQMPERGY